MVNNRGRNNRNMNSFTDANDKNHTVPNLQNNLPGKQQDDSLVNIKIPTVAINCISTR